MKQRLFQVVSLGLLILLISGCMAYQTETMVNTDGSGKNVITLGLSREYLEMMGEEDPFGDVEPGSEETVEGWRVQIEPWETEVYKGVKMTVDFNDLDTMVAQLNMLIGQTVKMACLSVLKRRWEGDVVVLTTSMYAEGMGEQELDPATEMMLEKFQGNLDG